MRVSHITKIGDDSLAIQECVVNALERSQWVIHTGGLGATHDDITKKTLAKSFNSALITDENYLENLKKRFKDSYKNSNGNRLDKIDDMIASQALILDNFNPIDNKLGTALGMIGTIKNTKIIVLPGVPKELKQMFY